MNPLLHWFASPEWQQVVQTLLHTIWQGVVLAVVLAFLMRRLANPVIRYRCSLAALALVVGGGILTWAVLSDSSHNTVSPRQSQPITVQAKNTQFSTISADAGAGQISSQVGRASPRAVPRHGTDYMAWTAFLWLAGAVVMLIRASVKLAGVEKLRQSCRPLDNPGLAQLLSDAQRTVGLARQVRLAVTDKLTSPAVLGVLMPTLVLPLSLLTTMTQEQIRFILLHELAHIQRGDYLANLFQVFTESILFFNPAVWWISHQVRREREVCCDALAIELSGAPADYAKTLIQVAEYGLNPAPAAAMAFGDKREPSSLTDRICRLLVPGYRPSLRLTWRAMLLAIIAGGTLLVISAVGTRMTVAALLTPQQRIDRISKKMVDYGENPEAKDSNNNTNRVAVTAHLRMADGSSLPKNAYATIHSSRRNYSSISSAHLSPDGTISNTVSQGQIWVEVDAEGFAPGLVGPFDGMSTNRIDAGEIVLDRGFEVILQVADANTGAPIPNAAVHAQFWLRGAGHGIQGPRDIKVNAAGKAVFAFCVNQTLSVSVNAPGYEIIEQRFESLSPNQTLNVKLHPGRSLNGTVVDKISGKPIAGAAVHMLFEKGPVTSRYQWGDAQRVLATTDESGRFVINQLQGNTTYWLGVSAANHESIILDPVNPATKELKAQLGPELIVRGHIIGDVGSIQKKRNEFGFYRNYYEIYENSSYGDFEWVPCQIVDGIARFQFTNRVAGLVRVEDTSFELQVDHPIEDWVIDLTKPKEQTPLQMREVVFRFTHSSSVTPRGTISVVVPDNLDNSHKGRRLVEKQITDGEVRVQLPIGERPSIETKHLVGYWFDHWKIISIEVTNGPGPMVVDVPLVPAGAIYAQARNVDGTLAGGLHFGVQELVRAPSRPQSSSIDSDDSFNGNGPRKWVSGPLPLGGTYQIYGHRGNSFCLSKPIPLTEENPDAEIELQFAAGKAIEGTLLNSEGQPVANVDLQPTFSLQSNYSFALKSAFTDERGRFQIEEATPGVGDYWLNLSIPGQMAEIVKLSSNNQTIRLKPGLTLSGSVIEEKTGYAIPNAEVRAFGVGQNHATQTARTDSSGHFEFTTLADTDYNLYVGDAQMRNNKKYRPGKGVNITLPVKLYEWSKLKPTPSK